MLCPVCRAENTDGVEACFTCGKALHALTQGTVLAGRYEVLRPLGKGGMGHVYKAHDRVLDDVVAIKVLRAELLRDPSMARRFRSEIKLARKVSHRNVCRIHEYGEDGGLRFISMEYVDGVNLRDHLRERAPAWTAAYDLSLQVAAGLQAVHEHGIIHRDFKASNIMIDPRGVVRLMDFGIAKDLEADTSAVSAVGGTIGTPEYMSPEHVEGARLDFRSDLYSLGCVVFEIFSGHAPFRGATPLITLYMHLEDDPPLEGPGAPPLPPSLIPILRQALAKQPPDRYADVAALIQALAASSRDELGERAPEPPSPAAQRAEPVDTDTRPPALVSERRELVPQGKRGRICWWCSSRWR